MKNEIKNAFIGVKTKLLSLMVALCVTTALWAQNNVITYTATSKLTKSSLDVDATTFGSAITSHTFSNGIGTITCSGEITTIEGYAFDGCSGLTSVTIPNSVTMIGDWAFGGCSGLTSVSIPNSVKTIEVSAFRNCSGLTSITIPNSVTTIGNEAFRGCSALASVTIGNSVTTIGDYAFENCRGLTSITIPNSVTTIGDRAFKGCSGLTSVSIPNSVTTIGGYAFRNCSGLTSVTIPNSVTMIGDWAFGGCSGLTSVSINSNAICSKTYTSSSNIEDIFGSQVKEYIIRDSVTTIGDHAFDNCTGLTSITIPKSITSIGAKAFYNTISLDTLYWNAIYCKDLVIEKGSDAPFYDSGMKVLVCGDSVRNIPDRLCHTCRSLREVYLSQSLERIGMRAFFRCPINTIIIPKNVSQIGEYAFCDDALHVPSYVEMWATTPPILGSWIFGEEQNYTPLSTPIYVPCGSLSVYQQAEYWKDNILYSIEQVLVSVNNSAYGSVQGGGHQKSENVTLTAVPTYGYYFVQWNDGNTDNPRRFILTQDTAFTAQFEQQSTITGRCGEDLTWTLHEGVLTITGSGDMYDSHYDSWSRWADQITTINLPTGLTHIGDNAFANCVNVSRIDLPASVTSIGCRAFYNDYNIEEITCPATAVPTIDCDETFYKVSQYVYVYVISDLVRKYQINQYWQKFDIRVLGAEGKIVTEDNVIVLPSTDNATFTWPQNDQASEYVLEITKDGVVFCTLKFNAQGQLTGIAFAPGRDGAREMASATMTANGWQFTVTGLNQGSKYGYTLDALNASQQSIKHYEGEFTTTGSMPTGINELTIDDAQCTMKKFIRNNQLHIFRNGKMYNALGGEGIY